MAKEQETIAKLQQENAELQTKLAEALAAGDQKDESLANADKMIGELTAKYDALQAEKDAADKTISNLLEATKHMAQQGSDNSVAVTAKEEAPKMPEPFELNGKTVRFLKPFFHFENTTYTAAQAAALPELIDAIVAIEGQKIVSVE